MAIGRNRELGRKGKLLWHIPDDLKRFKQLTLGRPIIMGRKTFESIVGYLGKPLPGRTSIVVTRNPKMIEIVSQSSDVLAASSLEEAIEKARQFDSEEIHIGGGAEIYKQALPMIDKLYLTHIDAEAPDADTFFPEYEKEFTRETFRENREWNGTKYTWIDFER